MFFDESGKEDHLEVSDEVKGSNVVYVEDDPIMREHIARFLRRRVNRISTAENGKIGLDVIKSEEPDIVLTDLEMPVMNGLVMIEHIRNEFGNDAPIIVLTAYKDETHYTPLADAYIYKPVDIPTLVNLMTKLLREKRTR